MSKALGEKTITRDNISVNKDREDWKQGKSESDQVMGRALMTPDELRRMDNDLCIIYEKGIKPVKANKYYYFKYPEGKLVTKFKVDHNDVNIERGVWRKFNPYAPRDEAGSTGGGAAASLESLDNLFADESDELNVPNTANNNISSVPQPSMMEEHLDPVEEEKRQAELIDIQKELEAKFDELFGSIDSDD